METTGRPLTLESTERRARAWLLVVGALALALSVAYHLVNGPGPHNTVFSIAAVPTMIAGGGILFVIVVVPWTQRLADRWSLPQLQWMTTLLPAAAILLVEAIFYVAHRMGAFTHAEEHLVLASVLLVASVPFCLFVFDVFRRIHHEMVAQNARIAIMEERERIAREMHDSFGQMLGYVNTKAQAARLMCEEGQLERARTQIVQLSDATREMYGDVRDTILGLRSTAFLDEGLVPALDLYTRQFADQTGIVTAFEACPGADQIAWGPEVEVQVFRVVQEALANIRKHASAARARVSVNSTGGVTEITVEDPGVGFDPDAAAQDGSRFGLRTMRERAQAIGAQFVLSSAQGAGTRVALRLPTLQLRRSAP